MAAGSWVTRARRGYHAGPRAERSGFAVSLGLTAAIWGARALNYVRERRRSLPLLRSLSRRVYHSPGSGKPRIHHFASGTALAFLAGGASIFTRDGEELAYGVPFGIGAGLTLDEVPMLGQLDNPYWGFERLALLEGAAAASLATWLGVRFVRRGAQLAEGTSRAHPERNGRRSRQMAHRGLRVAPIAEEQSAERSRDG
jgi:hypothetical protein